MYPVSYLQVSQSVSARIPFRVCTYPSPYLNVYPYGSARIPFVSERFPVHTCSCPVCVCIYNLRHIRPNIGPAGQPNCHTHTHTQPLTHQRSLCRVFLTAARKRRYLASAASATASVWMTARSCMPLRRFPEQCCVLAKSGDSHLPPAPSDWSWKSLSMAMVHLDERQRFHNEISKRKNLTFHNRIIRLKFSVRPAV